MIAKQESIEIADVFGVGNLLGRSILFVDFHLSFLNLVCFLFAQSFLLQIVIEAGFYSRATCN